MTEQMTKKEFLKQFKRQLDRLVELLGWKEIECTKEQICTWQRRRSSQKEYPSEDYRRVLDDDDWVYTCAILDATTIYLKWAEYGRPLNKDLVPVKHPPRGVYSQEKFKELRDEMKKLLKEINAVWSKQKAIAGDNGTWVWRYRRKK